MDPPRGSALNASQQHRLIVLPVGVTPATAVPTRIGYGSADTLAYLPPRCDVAAVLVDASAR
jgi:hypothetical protein